MEKKFLNKQHSFSNLLEELRRSQATKTSHGFLAIDSVIETWEGNNSKTSPPPHKLPCPALIAG